MNDEAWVKAFCLAHSLHLTPDILAAILERIAIKVDSGESEYDAKIDSISDFFGIDLF